MDNEWAMRRMEERRYGNPKRNIFDPLDEDAMKNARALEEEMGEWKAIKQELDAQWEMLYGEVA